MVSIYFEIRIDTQQRFDPIHSLSVTNTVFPPLGTVPQLALHEWITDPSRQLIQEELSLARPKAISLESRDLVAPNTVLSA